MQLAFSYDCEQDPDASPQTWRSSAGKSGNAGSFGQIPDLKDNLQPDPPTRDE
jgi:hypothetical protein